MEALKNGTLFTSSQWQCEHRRSCKWSTINCLTVTVWRWTLLQMEHYSLPHNDGVEMYALTNGALFSASKWKCEDGCSYKWTTIHCLKVTVWRWTLLQIDRYSVPHNDGVDGCSYKWTAIFCFTVTVRRWTLLLLDHYSQPDRDSTNMDAPRNGLKFIASQWQCGDGRSYKWTTIHCLTVIVCTWTLLERNNYSLHHSDSVQMDALTNGSLFTASQWQCEDGRS